MTYTERSTQLALDASVAVQVLLGDAPEDCEFVPLKPRMADAEMWAELKARWPGRGLRAVGIIGLVGVTPKCALKEPISEQQISALTVAFLAYLNVLFADSFATQFETAEPRLDPEYDWAKQQYRFVPRYR